jgi:hypothetical protein
MVTGKNFFEIEKNFFEFEKKFGHAPAKHFSQA